MKRMIQHNENHIELRLFAGVYHARREAPGEWYGQAVPHGAEGGDIEGPFGTYLDAIDAVAESDGDIVADLRDRVTDVVRGRLWAFSEEDEYPEDVRQEAQDLLDRWNARPNDVAGESGISFGNMMAEFSEEQREEWLMQNAAARENEYRFFVRWIPDAREFVQSL